MKRLFSLTALLICAVMALSLLPLSVSAAEFTGDDRIVIVLDPGHGTAGEPNEYNQSEGSYNMRTAKYMKAALEANSSFAVYMTNEANSVDRPHYERAAFADSVNADLMISIHYNSAPNPDLNGMEAWSSVIPKFDTAELAGMCVDYGVAAVPGLENGGVNQRKDNAGFYWDEKYQWDIEGDPTSGVLSDYYGIITWGLKFGVPTFILEEMYLSNEHDRALASDANIKAMAEAQAQAIIDYYTGHGHTYGEVQTDIPLSCITPGKQSEHCTECGHRRNVTTVADAPDPSAHFYRFTDPADPDGEWTCVYTHSLINKAKLEHEHHTGGASTAVIKPMDTTVKPGSDTVQTNTPTDGADHTHDYKVTGGYEVAGAQSGFAIFTCSVCDDKYREELNATHDCDTEGHVLMAYSLVPGYEEQYIDTLATCETDGEQYSFCMVCNYAGSVIEPATGHQYTVVNEVAATCDTVGKVEKHCSICARSVVEDVPVLGHTFETELIQPSCESGGQQTERCTVCGDDKSVTLPPVGHTYESTVKKEATAGEDGERVFNCTVCGDSYSQPIPAKSGSSFSLPDDLNIPLPIIAFSIVIVMLVAAIIIIPVIIRKKRFEAEEDIVPEAMDFTPEDVTINDKGEMQAEPSPVPESEPESEPDYDPDELVSEVIPEIAQVVEEETADDSFSLDDIHIPVVNETEVSADEPLEEVLEALKQSFSSEDETEE